MVKIVLVLTWLVATTVLSGPVSAAGRAPNDPYAEQQWALEQIEAIEAWDHATGKGAVVAVVDSGIDLKHPDLKANVLRKGRDFIDSGPAEDEFGHGTHVAGIIAAVTNNGRGIAGIAPSAKLMSVRILDENNGASDDEDLPKAIRWAAANGADVINLSVGFPVPAYGHYYTALISDVQDAIEFAWRRGAVVVVAAGNSSQPLCDRPLAPALCVGATGAFEQKTHYSNFDATLTEDFVVAPGGETIVFDCEWTILSTWLREKPRTGSCAIDPGYAGAGGTSMAAPMVSGVAALLVEQGLSNEEIVERILSTSDDLGSPGRDPIYGWGRVNALRAVTAGS